MVNFSFILVVFLLFATSGYYSVKFVDVDTICKNATNPSFCSTLLNSKPGGGSGDLVNLAEYTLSVVQTNVTNTIDQIKELIKQSGSNFAARTHYEACLGNFGDEIGALDAIEAAQGALKMGKYKFAHDEANDISFFMFLCISGNSPSDPPFHDTSLLPKYVDIVDQIAKITVLILNYLI
jgi:pectinesterase inhibitor-like protein